MKNIKYHSLGHSNKVLANEWHCSKNTLTPFDIFASSKIKVWWKCGKGHEWVASVKKRSEGRGCPDCYAESFAVKNPINNSPYYIQLNNEWDKDKNVYLNIDAFSISSKKRVWWKCAQGHSWDAVIYSRTAGNGCPICAGRIIVLSNCLATTHPKVAAEWHPDKNGLLTPFDIAASSATKAWWQCEQGHEWETGVNVRTYQESKCTKCQGYVIRHINDIYNDDRTEKRCKGCDTMLSLNNYSFKIDTRSDKGYYTPLCKKCEKGNRNKYQMTEYGIASTIVSYKKNYCKKHKIAFDLTTEWVLARLKEIDWKCELTGIPMAWNRCKSKDTKKVFPWNSISLDRIIPSNGYTKHNVRFVINRINVFRGDSGDELMYIIAEALMNNKV